MKGVIGMSNQVAGIFIAMIGMLFLAVAVISWICDKSRRGKYTEQVYGTVIEHEWVHAENVAYPRAVLTYTVNQREYRCVQRYSSVIYNTVKHAKYDWEIDDKYRLHSYVTRKCEIHVNPVEDWCPIGSQMPVYYVPGKPQKAYCGALVSMKLMRIIFAGVGVLAFVFGILLHFVL